MANLALNRPRRSRFASPLKLRFEPILLATHLLAQLNYGDNRFITRVMLILDISKNYHPLCQVVASYAITSGLPIIDTL
jgi:hypothetical protein